uniref:Uncharacterized protein n=1 Tax=Lates calcarifer TaxID=8187 RepID=A0A4W6C7A0_LATCA
MVQPRQVTGSQQQEDGDLVRKLPNPVLASHQHRNLHQELLLCHRRGLLPRVKPELQRVLEHKVREQHKQREVALHSPSDLEAKLRTWRERIQVVSLLAEEQETVFVIIQSLFERRKGTRACRTYQSLSV